MMSTGKCPKCERVLSEVQVEDVPLKVGMSPAWASIMMVCPACRTCLGVAINPLVLNRNLVADVTTAVVQKLRAQ